MGKPRGDPSRGISSEDVLIRPERHPACRRCRKLNQALGSNVNLTGDAKGKAQAAPTARPKVPDAPERGGLPCSSDEAGVMPGARRGRVSDVGLGQPATGGARYSMEGGDLRAKVTRAG